MFGDLFGNLGQFIVVLIVGSGIVAMVCLCGCCFRMPSRTRYKSKEPNDLAENRRSSFIPEGGDSEHDLSMEGKIIPLKVLKGLFMFQMREKSEDNAKNGRDAFS